MSYECSEEKECFACDCKNAGLPTLKIQGLSNNGFGLADKISYRRAAVSSYDKIHGTNVLEAQTIGLELIKLYDEKAFAVADILTFTTEQCAAVRSVLSAVAEKSVGVRDALSDGRITVGFAGDRRSVCCDVLYISTVFGKDEASSMCTSCGALDDVFGASQGISDMITSALSGCARNIVVVSSISPDVCPDRAGSFGIKQLLKLAAFAQSFGKMRVAGEEGVVSPCVSEFGRLVSENGFCVCETHDENSAVLDIGGKNVAAVFEKTGSRAAFDRECRTLCEWEMRGYQVHRLDCADMALNPLKILDSINNLTEENK